MKARILGLSIPIALVLAACSSRSNGGADAGAPTPVDSATTAPATPAASANAPSAPAALVREGNVVARKPAGDGLYIVDEDHRAVRIVALPFDPAAKARAVDMPGAPAQIVALADRVLVTVRDPGLLLVFRPDAAAGLVEVGRVALPADAWGLGVSADGATAIVTSAWTHQVSAIDLGKLEKRWSVDVAREPRGVVLRGGAAYVTHLVGAALTRIDGLAAPAPTVKRVDLPASSLRAPSGRALHAALGYAATLSDDGSRLFVARHALGAMGKEAWFGASTVDVLLTENDAPLAPKHFGKLPFLRADRGKEGADVALPGGPLAPFTQPRAIVYRKRTQTILVAGEGDDRVVELDAVSLDPTLAVLRSYEVGGGHNPALPIASTCAAPAGLALSDDESTAWVFCRATYDLAEIKLAPDPTAPVTAPAVPRVAHLADDPIDANTNVGRRLFYSASEPVSSGGMACAGCHPEGRDDGFTWHEAKFNTQSGTSTNFVGNPEQVPDEERVKGYPRRTPMLAGRVESNGPYGWHAESPDLADRLAHGFSLHRWGGMPKHEPGNLTARSGPIASFLRRGLVPPPRDVHPPTPEEERGRVVFNSEEAQCARCHVPASEYTDRVAYRLTPLPKRDDFDDEDDQRFKTPSLRFVGGRGPLFHDGSAASLEELVEKNNDRMGKTQHLRKEDRAALVAFLRTL
ncbi:Surface antigen [Minicystis rosea]|nr:Surface antigen [Minicystis rosea]